MCDQYNCKEDRNAENGSMYKQDIVLNGEGYAV